VSTRPPRPDDDFQGEPVRGLPAVLPPGERILWQGAPRWPSLALHAFRLRWVAAYFVLLAAWRAASAYEDGADTTAVLLAGLWPIGIGGVVLAVACAVAWYAARTTVYTITNRRVVFRIGMALTVSINLPFAVVGAASLVRHRDGTGDIALAVAPPARVSWVMFWPHARPWRFRRPQPMLRNVPEPERVAQILARALAAAADMPAPAVSEQPRDAADHARPVAA
jgi:hypothetical protein